MELMQNEYFNIFSKDSKIYISVFSLGFNLNSFPILLKDCPRICITQFLNLKTAIETCSLDAKEIGILKPRVEVNISPDSMKASIKLNITSNELESNKENIIKEILETLKNHDIIYGIIPEVLTGGLSVQTDIVIAKGLPPINGDDSIVKYIQLPSRKPTIKEDGSADYYEMNLIYEAKPGDYLGEKTLATSGIPGKTVQGQILPSKPGNDKMLNYDIKTVEQCEENGKLILKALINGAISFSEGKVSILNHLTINGDVGYETGNIDFEGYVTIKGTVSDEFSVVADKDISIESPIGIGAVDKIISRNGDIYIKGGVSGKGKAIIEAGKNVFIKYSNACTISSQENINIGFYSLDSNLTSKNIIVNSSKGRIIGGTINAHAKVVATTIGNKFEKRTVVNVKGFDRSQIKKELDDLLITYKKCLLEVEKNRREMKVYENTIEDINELRKIEEYKYYHNIHEKLMNQISKLEDKRKSLMDYLESKGEGEVSILKEAYPQTFLEIKNLQKVIRKVTSGTFYTQDNELHSE